MGNQLVGIAPSQIYPVEHYLTDLTEVRYDTSLGSTRFFKVARAKTKEGLIVVKVFVIHDPSLPLKAFKEKLEHLRTTLQTAVNCLPFKKTVLTDKAGIIMRQYVKSSLYDRISTRPFLISIEKKWIAFQVLCALAQCHKIGVCHGDIKLENIMVTSWNWVLLTDFASFKPTYLPEDNPADFSYFFDTSRRRTCYIAPERFIKTLNPETAASSQLLLPEEEIKKGDLTSAMDIFSAGCALTELFTEGHAPFDFSQLLAYRSGEYSPWKVLEKIDDTSIRELLRNMMQKDASLRLSAEDYLSQQRGKAFPEYFYTFLQSYMQIFSTTPIVSPDDKIVRLKKDIRNIIQMLDPEPEQGKDTESEKEKKVEAEKSFSEGLVIIVSLATSCLRALHHSTSKLYCLQVLKELSGHVSSETILDRILPYIFYLVHDLYPRVRVAAIQTLTSCLNLVKTVPRNDTNIFPEYVLPNLSQVVQDEAVIVRAAYAENIASLAETALRFLEMSQLLGGTHADHPQPSYEMELQTLHEMIQQIVSTLLTDPANIVKQTLMENGITRLCIFFGKQKANDVLLSHMITFLNDKEDKNLRGSFFDCIVGVSAYVGWQSSTILKPLLQQGLSDPEEFVMAKAINAVMSLTELGLLQKLALYELLGETACFLIHPNLWVRQAVVGLVSASARTLNLVDVQCKVVFLIQPYLEHPVIQVDKEVVVLNALKPPIPRIVYDSVVKCQDITTFLQTLEERQHVRSHTRLVQVTYPEINMTLKSLFRRLTSEGMTETVEDQLLAMKDHLLKLHKYKMSVDAKHSEHQEDGKVDLALLKTNVTRRHTELLPSRTKEEIASLLQARKRDGKMSGVESPSLTMNEEWLHMFGSAEQRSSSPKLTESLNVSPSTVKAADTDILGTTVEPDFVPASPSQSTVDEKNACERNYVQYRCAPCKLELRNLIMRKMEEQTKVLLNKETVDHATWDAKLPPPGWKPKGSLVAHLHEHRGSINRIVTIPETTLFASCSSDGCIRIWDCGKIEGKNIANRSRQMYNRQGGALTSITVCQNQQALASASDNGSIHVFKVDSRSSKMGVLYTRQLDIEEDGCAVDMTFFDSGSQSLLTYATVYGSIVGWDLRSPGTAWKLENDLKYGLITSFCVDPQQSWLLTGTAAGTHICWDLRFQLPVATFVHPTGARVRKVVRHPTQQSWVVSAVQGNNEVSMWNLETQSREMALWASSSPPLSQIQVSAHSVCAMCIGMGDHAPFLLTGGTDMKLRYWDLGYPNASYVVAGAANDTTSLAAVTYQTKLIDGTEVVQELYTKPPNVGSRTDSTSRPGPEQPPSGHHDWISDIALCQVSQCYVITGSQDGVIKVWK